VIDSISVERDAGGKPASRARAGRGRVDTGRLRAENPLGLNISTNPRHNRARSLCTRNAGVGLLDRYMIRVAGLRTDMWRDLVPPSRVSRRFGRADPRASAVGAKVSIAPESAVMWFELRTCAVPMALAAFVSICLPGLARAQEEATCLATSCGTSAIPSTRDPAIAFEPIVRCRFSVAVAFHLMVNCVARKKPASTRSSNGNAAKAAERNMARPPAEGPEGIPAGSSKFGVAASAVGFVDIASFAAALATRNMRYPPRPANWLQRGSIRSPCSSAYLLRLKPDKKISMTYLFRAAIGDDENYVFAIALS
jgi:hypothetical protein